MSGSASELAQRLEPVVTRNLEAACAQAGRLAALRQKRVLNAGEVEDLYSLDAGALKRMRMQGRGPRYFQENRRVLYRVEDVEEFMRQHLKRTADQPEDPRAAA